MTMLEEIAAYLVAGSIQTGSGLLATGLNLVLGRGKKQTPEILVRLIEIPGETDERVFVNGTDGIAFEQPHFQVQVRDINYVNAKTTMLRIKGRINGIGNQKLPDSSGTLYGSILAWGSDYEIDMMPDEQLMPFVTIAQNFQVRRKWSAA